MSGAAHRACALLRCALVLASPSMALAQNTSTGWVQSLFVREEVAVNADGGLTENKKPATLQVAHTDGKNTTTAKVAVVYEFKAFDRQGTVASALPLLRGWQPFAGYGWIRDPAAKTPKDQRDLSVGMAGSNVDAYETGYSLFSVLKATRRHERYTDVDSNLLNANVNLVVLKWVNRSQDPGANWHLSVPYMGLLTQDRGPDRSGQGQGRLDGAYLGWRHTIKLLALNDRLSLGLQAQYYKDFSATRSLALREVQYGTATLSYALPAPENSWFVPSLELKHERGTNPVTGAGLARKTTFSIGIKIN